MYTVLLQYILYSTSYQYIEVCSNAKSLLGVMAFDTCMRIHIPSGPMLQVNASSCTVLAPTLP
jgi:hypothetical protein